mgnify:CR=1 FL=1
MNGNNFMAWLLRSPFHGMLSNGMMLITVTGRKTGLKYTTPVGYFEEDNHLWVFTSRNRTWWRNLCGGAPVSLLLKRRTVEAFAEPVLDERAVGFWMHEYLRHVPQAAHSLGIRVKDGVASEEDVARIAKDRLFVRINLS